MNKTSQVSGKTKASSPKILTNITKFKKETTELEWKIENFRPLVHSLKKEKKAVTKKPITNLKNDEPSEVATWEFTAGKDLGRPTDWHFTLHIEENDKKKKALYLYLGCDCESQITAGFRVTVKSNKNPCALCYDNGLQYYCIVPTRMWGHNLGELSSILGPSSEYLTHDGSIIFNIHFEMFGDLVNVAGTGGIKKAIKLVDNSSDVLQDVMTKMLDDPDLSFADVTFTFPKEEEIELKAHKYILAARSPVFQRMFEAEMIEKASGIVVIEDMSSKAMKLVLRFIYTGGLLSNEKKDDLTWYDFAEEIVYASSKYDLPQLRNYCDCNLIRTCTKEDPFVALDFLKVAMLHKLKTAAADIVEFLKINLQDMVADTIGK